MSLGRPTTSAVNLIVFIVVIWGVWRTERLLLPLLPLLLGSGTLSSICVHLYGGLGDRLWVSDMFELDLLNLVLVFIVHQGVAGEGARLRALHLRCRLLLQLYLISFLLLIFAS